MRESSWRSEPAELEVPGGERLIDVAERAWNGLQRIAARHVQDENLIVVSHNFPIVGIVCPNIVYPYLRANVADLISRTGLPPIHLAEINFEALYQERDSFKDQIVQVHAHKLESMLAAVDAATKWGTAERWAPGVIRTSSGAIFSTLRPTIADGVLAAIPRDVFAAFGSKVTLLEVLPAVTYSNQAALADEGRLEQTKNRGELSLTATYGVTSRLTLDGTVNPYFLRPYVGGASPRTTFSRSTFPWRTFVITEDDGGLIESTMVYRLAAPLALADASWIRPGKVAWDWWNANNIPDDGCEYSCTFASRRPSPHHPSASADARQHFSSHHIQNARAADAGAEQHPPFRLFLDDTDAHSVCTVRMSFQRCWATRLILSHRNSLTVGFASGCCPRWRCSMTQDDSLYFAHMAT